MALLYEAIQTPVMPLEAPVLNPTGGVKGRQQAVLDYKPDPTRPGTGVFVAHGQIDSDPPMTTALAASTQSTTSSGPIVNFTPLTGAAIGSGVSNVNPAMNVQAGTSDRIINTLDTPATVENLAEFAVTDTGFLEGMPNLMFDWGKYCSLVAKVNLNY